MLEVIGSLCNTCGNNTEAYPFLQCVVEPLEPRTQYIKQGKYDITKEEYEYLISLRKNNCEEYNCIVEG